jgi:hypothetical protein
MNVFVINLVKEICAVLGLHVEWYFRTDVSGQPIGLIFKG